MQILVFGPFCSMASHGQHCSHGRKTILKKWGSSLPLQLIFPNRIFQNYLNCIEKGQKEHKKCYMISNPTPKFTSQIRLIRSVFGRNRTGTGSEKIDRNRISGRTLKRYLFSIYIPLTSNKNALCSQASNCSEPSTIHHLA